ncbi:MAG: hypothetical protein MO853_10975 [Candidatus Protistobacter heckmanni]|nr:hypothetical protein [Candidatus Protistobacter heckmanni]
MKRADTVTFSSMTKAGEISQLAAAKAVSEAYPLRGKLKTAAAPNGPETEAASGPPPGAVWVDPGLAAVLQTVVVGTLKLGKRELCIDRLLTHELDRGAGFLSFAPRAMFNMADLDATGLITFGSRATYRLLLAGPDQAVHDYLRWAEPSIAAPRCAARAAKPWRKVSRRCAPRSTAPAACSRSSRCLPPSSRRWPWRSPRGATCRAISTPAR